MDRANSNYESYLKLTALADTTVKLPRKNYTKREKKDMDRITSRAGGPQSSCGVSRCSRSNANPSHFPGPTNRATALRKLV